MKKKCLPCWIFIIIILFNFVGCSNSGSYFLTLIKQAENSNKSIVYIYRPYNFCGSLSTADIFINKKKFITLKNTSYSYVFLDPGSYTFTSKGDWKSYESFQSKILLWPKISKYYFLRFDINCNLGKSGGTFIKVEENQAIPEIQKTRFQKQLYKWFNPAKVVSKPLKNAKPLFKTNKFKQNFFKSKSNIKENISRFKKNAPSNNPQNSKKYYQRLLSKTQNQK